MCAHVFVVFHSVILHSYHSQYLIKLDTLNSSCLAFWSVACIWIRTRFYLCSNSCNKFQACLIRLHAGSTHRTVLTLVLHVIITHMLVLHVMSHQCWFYMSHQPMLVLHISITSLQWLFYMSRHVTPVLVLHIMSFNCWFYTSCHTIAGSTDVASMLVLNVTSRANSTRHVAPILVLHIMSHQCWFYISCHTCGGWIRHVMHLLILRVAVTGSKHHITNTSVSIINLLVTCYN